MFLFHFNNFFIFYFIFRLSAEHLHRLYVFSLVWGIGAFLENDDRNKYDDYIRTKFTIFDLPAAYDINISVFDFYVSTEGEDCIFFFEIALLSYSLALIFN